MQIDDYLLPISVEDECFHDAQAHSVGRLSTFSAVFIDSTNHHMRGDGGPAFTKSGSVCVPLSWMTKRRDLLLMILTHETEVLSVTLSRFSELHIAWDLTKRIHSAVTRLTCLAETFPEVEGFAEQLALATEYEAKSVLLEAAQRR